MFSLGIELSRAFWMAVASDALESGSPPPSLAATMIARESFEKSWPRLASAAPFLRLMVAHLLCPDMTLPPLVAALALTRPRDEPLVEPALARQLVEEAGVTGRVEIRLQDYRDLRGEQFDAISSVGMSEHVGHDKLDTYLATLRSALRPQGRLLNHAISSVGGSMLGPRSFVGRYVFPDGELIDVGDVVLEMERAGLEVRDVESLREHYARTLRCWVSNLESNWEKAVQLVGEPRAKVWRLYMAGSAVGFEDGGIAIHQVLGVVPTESGNAAMPATRRDWG